MRPLLSREVPLRRRAAPRAAGRARMAFLHKTDRQRCRDGGGMLSEIQIGGDSEPMPVNLSIKNAPDEVVQRLRQRAARHHRSLQGELLAIIEEAARSEQELSPAELLAEVLCLGLNTPADSAAIIRADRDRH